MMLHYLKFILAADCFGFYSNFSRYFLFLSALIVLDCIDQDFLECPSTGIVFFWYFSHDCAAIMNFWGGRVSFYILLKCFYTFLISYNECAFICPSVIVMKVIRHKSGCPGQHWMNLWLTTFQLSKFPCHSPPFTPVQCFGQLNKV